MVDFTVPNNEAERLKALIEYDILDSLPEEEFDRITELASIICEVPVSLVSLIDRDRQWYKSRFGSTESEAPRKISLCNHAIMDCALFEVEDATLDDRFKNFQNVISYPNIRFYASYPLIDPNGFALGTLCVYDHIPKKLTENQQKALTVLAKEIVLQIVARKERSELRNAKMIAENANRMKSIFLGNLSHEIRTPLQTILGFSEILSNADIPKQKVLEYLNIIKKRTIDLQNILDSLLDLASLETGELKAYPSEISLATHIIQLVESFKQESLLSTSKRLPIRFEDRTSGSLALVDPLHFTQVMRNLINNAIKFTESGLIQITLEMNGGAFEVTVADSGIGIPAEKLELIFEPFRQAHEGLSRAKGGIGLGLFICKKMSEMWGGTILAKSEVGVGSVFTIILPRST